MRRCKRCWTSYSLGRCETKPQWDNTSTPTRMAVIKIWTVTSVGKDVKKHALLMHPTSFVAGRNVKWYKWTCLQSRKLIHRYRKQAYGYHGGKKGDRDLETGSDTCPLAYLYIKDNKNLWYALGNSVQDSAVIYMGLESRREWICVLWIVESLYSRK